MCWEWNAIGMIGIDDFAPQTTRKKIVHSSFSSISEDNHVGCTLSLFSGAFNFQFAKEVRFRRPKGSM